MEAREPALAAADGAADGFDDEDLVHGAPLAGRARYG
jgi:hypothetical protein